MTENQATPEKHPAFKAPGSAQGRYRSAPERIRLARIIFAYVTLAALVGVIVLLSVLQPTEDSYAHIGIGALVSLNHYTFRFLYGDKDE